MVEKRIRALRDFELKTCFATYFLSKGEIRAAMFKSQANFDSLLGYNNFEEVGREAKEVKDIPVVMPEDSQVKVGEGKQEKKSNGIPVVKPTGIGTLKAPLKKEFGVDVSGKAEIDVNSSTPEAKLEVESVNTKMETSVIQENHEQGKDQTSPREPEHKTISSENPEEAG